jgi:hypothetical protein
VCLSIAIDRPTDVLAIGEHLGFEWIVTNNGSGYRCGYVRVPKGHPWHGKTWSELADVECHGGVTFAEPDKPCKGGPDDAHWVGFDCCHSWDLPDPELKSWRGRDPFELPLTMNRLADCEVRSQEYVERHCRSLCEQAQRIASLLET